MNTASQSWRSKASRKGTARDRLLKTASKLLHRDGYNGLTMEKVAAASGVAKTTLYRHWPTKAALCMDIYLAEAGRELHDPDTGKVADERTQRWIEEIERKHRWWDNPLSSIGRGRSWRPGDALPPRHKKN